MSARRDVERLLRRTTRGRTALERQGLATYRRPRPGPTVTWRELYRNHSWVLYETAPRSHSRA